MKTRTAVFTIITILCLSSLAFAAPQKVNFQGKLTDAAGNPITANVSMTFRIYDVAINGTALWTEIQTVAVTNGIYNVQLGQINPLDTELTETKPLWLGVKVGADAEMSPRVELTPGVYDLIMLNTITVKNGNVGIGVSNPIEKLEVNGRIESGNLTIGPWPYDSSNYVFWGTNNLDQAIKGNFALLQHVTNGRTFVNSPERISFQIDNFDKMTIANNGYVGIGTATPLYTLHVNGTLYVSGGADLAEPFDMTNIDTLELGDVVVLDPANPKHLMKSMTAYDHKVAGIVSSSEQAGYVAGSRSDGSSDKPVALTGRVLCKVSAENGKIEVGDLLTTSNTPGYAMKATDRDRAFGAVLGKALEAFDGDTGMILVLVALQ